MKEGSGSTVVGILTLIPALLFSYMGVTRIWRWFTFEVSELLTFSLFYILIAIIFASFAVYGLSSRKTGINFIVIGSFAIASIYSALSAYYMVKGQFLGGSVTDVFNSLNFLMGSFVMIGLGGVSGYIGKKRGIIDAKSNSDFDLSQATSELRGSWEEGTNRGERRSENAANRYYQFITGIPSLLWFTLIILGSTLSFSLWFTVESDIGMSVSLLGGMIVLFFSTLFDIQRVNRMYDDTNFRWYAYSIPAALPLFGWVIGFTWLLRKKQKLGSITA